MQDHGGGAASRSAWRNGTIFLSSSAGDTPGTEPKYTRGDTIYVNGTSFDANQAFTLLAGLGLLSCGYMLLRWKGRTSA